MDEFILHLLCHPSCQNETPPALLTAVLYMLRQCFIVTTVKKPLLKSIILMRDFTTATNKKKSIITLLVTLTAGIRSGQFIGLTMLFTPFQSLASIAILYLLSPFDIGI